jgi:hypothetical protein
MDEYISERFKGATPKETYKRISKRVY